MDPRIISVDVGVGTTVCVCVWIGNSAVNSSDSGFLLCALDIGFLSLFFLWAAHMSEWMNVIIHTHTHKVINHQLENKDKKNRSHKHEKKQITNKQEKLTQNKE